MEERLPNGTDPDTRQLLVAGGRVSPGFLSPPRRYLSNIDRGDGQNWAMTIVRAVSRGVFA